MANIHIGSMQNSVVIGGDAVNSKISTAQAPEIEMFAQLNTAIKNIEQLDARMKMQACATELQAGVGKSSYNEKYKEFIQLAANHMTLIGPYLPYLAMFIK